MFEHFREVLGEDRYNEIMQEVDKEIVEEELNNLNKGIDDLIEKYNKRFERKGFYLDVENTMICEFIKELKKLKGE